jgi:hypothetical protein
MNENRNEILWRTTKYCRGTWLILVRLFAPNGSTSNPWKRTTQSAQNQAQQTVLPCRATA